MFNRIKAYIRRRRTRKQIKKMTKAGREAAVRLNEAMQNATIAFGAFAEGLSEANTAAKGENDETKYH